MLTLSTCWYELKSKFDKKIYEKWISNLLLNVNNFNLVIYSDSKSINIFNNYLKLDSHLTDNYYNTSNPKIKLIILELDELYNYKYKNYWIKNHKNNSQLNSKIDWKLNMLWSEKISFVKKTIENKFFDSKYYGWVDIGYFRCRPKPRGDISYYNILNWPNVNKLKNLNSNYIHYALVNNNHNYIKFLYNLINNKNDKNLPINPIPPNQVSVAGGFFILTKNLIDYWFNLYDNKLKLYFQNNYLVKDDQIILIDCIFSNLKLFKLYKENNLDYDNWFLFQRVLI